MAKKGLNVGDTFTEGNRRYRVTRVLGEKALGMYECVAEDYIAPVDKVATPVINDDDDDTNDFSDIPLTAANNTPVLAPEPGVPVLDDAATADNAVVDEAKESKKGGKKATAKG